MLVDIQTSAALSAAIHAYILFLLCPSHSSFSSHATGLLIIFLIFLSFICSSCSFWRSVLFWSGIVWGTCELSGSYLQQRAVTVLWVWRNDGQEWWWGAPLTAHAVLDMFTPGRFCTRQLFTLSLHFLYRMVCVGPPYRPCYVDPVRVIVWCRGDAV